MCILLKRIGKSLKTILNQNDFLLKYFDELKTTRQFLYPWNPFPEQVTPLGDLTMPCMISKNMFDITHADHCSDSLKFTNLHIYNSTYLSACLPKG